MVAKKSAFDRYVDEQKKNPEFAGEYDRAAAEIRAIDDFVRRVDAARIQHGMSKADLARKVATTPEAMRRLLTSPAANPTLQTILSVIDAVGLQLTLTEAAASRAPTSRPSSVKVSGRNARAVRDRKIA